MTNHEPSAVLVDRQQGLLVNHLIVTVPLQHLRDDPQHQINRMTQCTLENSQIAHFYNVSAQVGAFFRFSYTYSTQEPEEGSNWAEML